MERVIIKALREKNGFVSGEELSREIGVSRTAIWKHIKELRENGYVIESRSKLGYRLSKSTEKIDKGVINEALETSYVGREILVFDSIDSTNSEAKRRTVSTFFNGLTLISEEQTDGRGRLGRNWTSPKGKGLWMSVVIKPEGIEPQQGSKLTIVAAAAVAKAIEKITKLKVSIKWPNDIVCNGRKVCGILTEMGADPDIINWLVLGIGINVNLDSEDFPLEIRETGTSLKIEAEKSIKSAENTESAENRIGKVKGIIENNEKNHEKDLGNGREKSKIDRNLLAAAILNELELFSAGFLKTGELTEVLDYYREKVIAKDRPMMIHKKDETLSCTGVGISDDGHLIVKLEDGTIQEFMSGEVSVRGIYGYI